MGLPAALAGEVPTVTRAGTEAQPMRRLGDEAATAALAARPRPARMARMVSIWSWLSVTCWEDSTSIVPAGMAVTVDEAATAAPEGLEAREARATAMTSIRAMAASAETAATRAPVATVGPAATAATSPFTTRP